MTDTTNDQLLDDGFGNIWQKCDHELCGLHIVRPGKVQCDICEYENEQSQDGANGS